MIVEDLTKDCKSGKEAYNLLTEYYDELFDKVFAEEYEAGNMLFSSDEEELYDKMREGVVGTMVDYLDQYISLVKVETLDDICRSIIRTRMECYNYKYKKKHNID